MNLYDEDHVDYIMRVMPQLQFLNGLPVEREDEDSSFIGAEEEAPSRRQRDDKEVV